MKWEWQHHWEWQQILKIPLERHSLKWCPRDSCRSKAPWFQIKIQQNCLYQMRSWSCLRQKKGCIGHHDSTFRQYPRPVSSPNPVAFVNDLLFVIIPSSAACVFKLVIICPSALYQLRQLYLCSSTRWEVGVYHERFQTIHGNFIKWLSQNYYLCECITVFCLVT